jgi:arabinose-5-phosphate isomerase
MKNAIALARQTIATEIEALQIMSERLTTSFQAAVDLILHIKGRVVVVGMGKSGIIGQKIVATLASTGTPSFFVHPGEAFHGDLGMIKPYDAALMISNSGETDEVIRLLPFMKYQKNKIIAMTGNTQSTLAKHADVVLDVFVPREACAINLAPTSSTTATLVMGDALAIALSVERNFQPEDFARFHPGGALGRKLLTTVADVMRINSLPICQKSTKFRDVIHIVNKGRLGIALVVEEGRLSGLITDGDIRRAFDNTDEYKNLYAKDIMTKSPKTIAPNVRLSDAESIMLDNKISSLVVVDEEQSIQGVLQIYNI